ncbi:hypothetical protein [Klebsiella pneumoniae]|uniref:hypothetical protein n=1 Tax=Klebsiella pneumoniae TaxID=573 RepID=UPI0030F3F89C
MTPLVCQLTDRDRVRLSFRERGMTLQKLAGLIGEKRHNHVSEVLNNKPRHGHHTRPKLFPHLTAEEIRLLGWTTEYEAWRSTQNNVPTLA